MTKIFKRSGRKASKFYEISDGLAAVTHKGKPK